MTEQPIVIVGAGIGGLSAALCLVQQGFEVQVVERFDEVREVGAGILLAPNASSVLYGELGLGDQLDAVSAPMERGVIGSWRGKDLVNLPLGSGEFAGPSRMIHRAALQRVLLDAVGAERVRLGAAVTGYELTDVGAQALVEGGDSVEGCAVIGADGLHSMVRAQVVGDGSDPLRYHGYTCWRGITETFEHPEFSRELLTEVQGRGMRAGMQYVDAERVYWWATADVPEGQQDDPLTVIDDLKELYGEFPDHFLAMIDATPADQILRNDIYDRPPLKRWGEGPVTLLGDAAHPMAPNLGQGACSAIEDAQVLALCLAQFEPLEEGLRVYEELRRPRTAKLQKLSRQFGTMGQWSNPVAVKMREWSTALTPQRVVDGQQRELWGYYPEEVVIEAAARRRSQ